MKKQNIYENMLSLMNNIENKSSDYSELFYTHYIGKNKVHDNIKYRKVCRAMKISDTSPECMNLWNNFTKQF